MKAAHGPAGCSPDPGPTRKRPAVRRPRPSQRHTQGERQRRSAPAPAASRPGRSVPPVAPPSPAARPARPALSAAAPGWLMGRASSRASAASGRPARTMAAAAPGSGQPNRRPAGLSWLDVGQGRPAARPVQRPGMGRHQLPPQRAPHHLGQGQCQQDRAATARAKLAGRPQPATRPAAASRRSGARVIPPARGAGQRSSRVQVDRLRPQPRAMGVGRSQQGRLYHTPPEFTQRCELCRVISRRPAGLAAKAGDDALEIVVTAITARSTVAARRRPAGWSDQRPARRSGQLRSPDRIACQSGSARWRPGPGWRSARRR